MAVVDEAVAQECQFLDPSWVMSVFGTSRRDTDRLLSRLEKRGLLERVARGRYAVRQLGLLGVPSAAEDVALAVAAIFAGAPHRIAYRSALDHWGLLTRPAMLVQVASARRIRRRTISDRSLQVILEAPDRVNRGAVPAGAGAMVSNVERSLFDAASRVELVGGLEVLAEALSLAPEVDVARLRTYGVAMSGGAALRRLGAVADALGLDSLADGLVESARVKHVIDVDPSFETRLRGVVDEKWHVRWNRDRDEIVGVARS